MLMIANPTAYGRSMQPHSVEKSWHRPRMEEPNTRKRLWENVSRLMVKRYGKENLTQLAKDAKFGPGSATRLKDQSTSVGVDIVDRLAKLFKLEPWQLLVPQLNVDSPPRLDDQVAEFSPEASGAAEIVELLPTSEEKEQMRLFIRTEVLDRMVLNRRDRKSSGGQSDLPNSKQGPGVL